ncbi:MAG TPA: hypothetical protein VFG54_12195 [Prolixibacteraceae bacterium]|nr:hypothetical protein [Prolixibacteraceae bacterium]
MESKELDYRNLRLQGCCYSVMNQLEPSVFYDRMHSNPYDDTIKRTFEVIPAQYSDSDIEQLTGVNEKISRQMEKTFLAYLKARESVVSSVIKQCLKRDATIEDLKEVVFTYDERAGYVVKFYFKGILIGDLEFQWPQFDSDLDLVERFAIRFIPSPYFR